MYARAFGYKNVSACLSYDETDGRNYVLHPTSAVELMELGPSMCVSVCLGL